MGREERELQIRVASSAELVLNVLNQHRFAADVIGSTMLPGANI